MQQHSERHQLADRLAAFLIENDLCQVYGGTVDLVRQGRPHYDTAFSRCRVLDGSISVYSPTFILVSWQSANRSMPHTGERLFTSEQHAIDFIRLAFVEHDVTGAYFVPHRTKGPKA
jgi:hypothetical protein